MSLVRRGWTTIPRRLILSCPNIGKYSLTAPAMGLRWLDGVLDGDPPQFMSDTYVELSPDGAMHEPIVASKAAERHLAEPDVSRAQLDSVAGICIS